MNRSFKIVFNQVRGKHMVVNEKTSSHQGGRCKATVVAAAGLVMAMAGSVAMAADTAAKDPSTSLTKEELLKQITAEDLAKLVKLNNGQKGLALAGGSLIHLTPDAYRAKLMNFNQNHDAIADGIAIGKGTNAAQTSIDIGQRDFVGTMAGVKHTKGQVYKNYNTGATTVGANNFNHANMATSIGSFSSIICGGKANSGKGFGATVIGSLNQVYGDNKYEGIGNTILGVANKTENANGALISGVGNAVSNTLTKPGALDALSLTTGLKTASPDALADWIASFAKGASNAGAVMVSGGGNTVDQAALSQVVGLGNTLKGTSTSAAKENMITGIKNTVNNASNLYMIGSHNQVKDAKHNLVFGDDRSLENVNHSVIIGTTDKEGWLFSKKYQELKDVDNTVMIGHDAFARANNSVALGHESVALAENVVSIGNEKTQRKIVNVAAGEADTDAVNMSQIKAFIKADALTAEALAKNGLATTESMKTSIEAAKTAVLADADKKYLQTGALDNVATKTDIEGFIKADALTAKALAEKGLATTESMNSSIEAAKTAVLADADKKYLQTGALDNVATKTDIEGFIKADALTTEALAAKGLATTESMNSSIEAAKSAVLTEADTKYLKTGALDNVATKTDIEGFIKAEALTTEALAAKGLATTESMKTSIEDAKKAVLTDADTKYLKTGALENVATKTDIEGFIKADALTAEALAKNGLATTESMNSSIEAAKSAVLADADKKYLQTGALENVATKTDIEGFIKADALTAEALAKNGLATTESMNSSIEAAKSAVLTEAAKAVESKNFLTEASLTGYATTEAVTKLETALTEAGENADKTYLKVADLDKTLSEKGIVTNDTIDKLATKTDLDAYVKSDDLKKNGITGENFSLTAAGLATKGLTVSEGKVTADDLTVGSFHVDANGAKLGDDAIATSKTVDAAIQTAMTDGLGFVSHNDNVTTLTANKVAVESNGSILTLEGNHIASAPMTRSMNGFDLTAQALSMGSEGRTASFGINGIELNGFTVDKDGNVTIDGTLSVAGKVVVGTVGEDAKTPDAKPVAPSNDNTTEVDGPVTAAAVAAPAAAGAVVISPDGKVTVNNGSGDKELITAENVQKVVEEAVKQSAATSNNMQAQFNDFQNAMSEQVQRLDKRVDRSGANAAALAALHPQDFDENHKFTGAAGIGHYKGEQALAVGMFYRPTNNVMVSVGGSFAGSSDSMLNAGVSYRFGGATLTNATPTQLQSRVTDLTAQNRDLSAQLEGARGQIDSLRKNAERFDEQMTMMRKEIEALKAAK